MAVARVEETTLGAEARAYRYRSMLEKVSGLDKRELFERTYGELKRVRENYLPVWRDLSDYVKPHGIRRDVLDVNRGDRRDQAIIDSTPGLTLRTCQSGMHAGITSPARPWFKLTTADRDLAQRSDVKRWLFELEERMRTVMLRSNIYRALPICYGDIALFGVNATGLREDFKDIMRAYHYPLGTYAFGLDERGTACTFVREYTMTVRQLLREFGGEYGQPLTSRQIAGDELHWENFSITVKSLFMAGNLEARVPVLWFVCPNEDMDPGRLLAKDAMPWRSCWFEVGRDSSDFQERTGFLRESGHRLFPNVCPRWAAVGEDTYSVDCPGVLVLGDVKSLQFMAKRIAKAIDKGLDPPLTGQMALLNQKVSELPGDVTYVDHPDVRAALSPIHEVDPKWLDALVESSDRTAYRIERGMFADLFALISRNELRGTNPQKTAEEVRALKEEQLIGLGPVLESINDELLDPLIDRVFDIMLQFGAVPEPPEVLEGVDLKVEYTSIMAQAQKLLGVAGHVRFAAEVALVAPVWPEARHTLDPIEWGIALAEKLGVDPKVVRSKEDAAAAVTAEAEAIQQQQQAEAAKAGAQAANLLGATPTRGGSSTALDDMSLQQQQLEEVGLV